MKYQQLREASKVTDKSKDFYIIKNNKNNTNTLIHPFIFISGFIQR